MARERQKKPALVTENVNVQEWDSSSETSTNEVSLMEELDLPEQIRLHLEELPGLYDDDETKEWWWETTVELAEYARAEGLVTEQDPYDDEW